MCVSVHCVYLYVCNKPSFSRFTATKRRKSLWLFLASCHSLAKNIQCSYIIKCSSCWKMITNEPPWDGRGRGPPGISLPWHTAAIIMLSETALRSSVIKYKERTEKMAAYYDGWFSSSFCACPEEVCWFTLEAITRRDCIIYDNWISVSIQHTLTFDLLKVWAANHVLSNSFSCWVNIFLNISLIFQFKPWLGFFLNSMHLLWCYFQSFGHNTYSSSNCTAPQLCFAPGASLVKLSECLLVA